MSYFDVELNVLDGLSVDSGGVGSLNRLWLDKIVINGDTTNMITAVITRFNSTVQYLTGVYDAQDMSTSYGVSYNNPRVSTDTEFVWLTVQTPAEIASQGLDDTLIFRRFKFPDDLPINYQPQLDGLNTRLTTAEATLVNHGQRLTTAENTLVNHGQRITTAENTIANHGSRIAAAENTLVSHGNQLVNHNQRITELRVEVNGLTANKMDRVPGSDSGEIAVFDGAGQVRGSRIIAALLHLGGAMGFRHVNRDTWAIRFDPAVAVTFLNNFKLTGSGNADVVFADDAKAEFKNSAAVSFRESAVVDFHESAKATFRGNSEVTFKDGTVVEFGGSSYVKIRDSVIIELTQNFEMVGNSEGLFINGVRVDSEGKMDKVESTSQGELAVFDGNGQVRGSRIVAQTLHLGGAMGFRLNSRDNWAIRFDPNVAVAFNNNFKFTGRDDADVIFADKVKARFTGDADVTFTDTAKAEFKGSAAVSFRESAVVDFHESAKATFRGNSVVLFKDGAVVEFGGSSDVNIRDSAKVDLSQSLEMVGNSDGLFVNGGKVAVGDFLPFRHVPGTANFDINAQQQDGRIHLATLGRHETLGERRGSYPGGFTSSFTLDIIRLSSGNTQAFDTVLQLAYVPNGTADRRWTQYSRVTDYQLDGGWTPWAEVGQGSGGIPDAPNDGRIYGRQNQTWAVVPSGTGGSSDYTEIKTFELPLTQTDEFGNTADQNIQSGWLVIWANNRYIRPELSIPWTAFGLPSQLTSDTARLAAMRRIKVELQSYDQHDTNALSQMGIAVGLRAQSDRLFIQVGAAATSNANRHCRFFITVSIKNQ